MNILKTESYKKGVLLSSLFNIGGKSIAFVQQWLIGFYFGTHSNTDVFFFTYNIILFISYFFLNFSTSVLIPESINIRNRESEESSMTFSNTFIWIYGVIGLLLFIIANVSTENLFSFISSFSVQIIDENINVIRWCLPLIFLNIVVSLMTELLASYKYFTIPNLINAINYLLGVTFIIFFHSKLGVSSIVLGLIFGYLINIIIIVWIMKHALKWSFTTFSFKSISVVCFKGMYAQIGFVIYLLALYVPQYYFTKFPEGSLTAINYADKITNIPGIFLVAQITNVMAIKFNNLVSQNKYKEVSLLTERLMLYVTTGLFFTAIFISLCSNWIVELMFSRGKFSVEALALTSQMLSLMILYLPFGFMYNMFMRLFNSFGQQKSFLWIQISAQGGTLLLYYILISNYGLVGYPISRIIAYLISIFFILPLFKHICPQIRTMRIGVYHLILSVFFLVYYLICAG